MDCSEACRVDFQCIQEGAVEFDSMVSISSILQVIQFSRKHSGTYLISSAMSVMQRTAIAGIEFTCTKGSLTRAGRRIPHIPRSHEHSSHIHNGRLFMTIRGVVKCYQRAAAAAASC
ncbi:PREDICTED: uncharacterized protein LOC106748630 [Dinoponera quadriceps]|uniref:Uncharacterized protein LOC106748630 n=1 Tax=Dinoponera quadriceps TaxID=609295 RepID=A0A6P3XW99_DINQU|nr:PREDICTED: uncharacterized protein LOC106748630 [Dinoponera quadriceps]